MVVQTHRANAGGRPIIRSLRPDGNWSWCSINRVGLMIRLMQVRNAPNYHVKRLMTCGFGERYSTNMGCAKARSPGRVVGVLRGIRASSETEVAMDLAFREADGVKIRFAEA